MQCYTQVLYDLGIVDPSGIDFRI